MKQKHVLYLSYDGMTDSLGQSQVLPYIIELTKKGYTFSIISFEKEEKFKQNKNLIENICSQNNIDWHPKKYTKKPPILSTIWDVFVMYQSSVKIHQRKKIDLIHCRSYQSALIGEKMKANYQIPWLFDMRGFWADERVDGNIWKLSNPIYKFIYNYYKKKEIDFFTDANGIISLTENGKKEIISWKDNESLPANFLNKKLDIEVIPCCVDTDLFNPNNINIQIQEGLREELKINKNDHIIGYVGSIGTWYMLPEMLDFYKLLLLNLPNLRFLFVTNEKKEVIHQLASEKNIPLSNLIITSCQHKEVPIYISLFDISIYFILPAYSKKASSPTKQAELMAMGIPIICNTGVGDSSEIVLKTNSGWVVNTFNLNEYNEVIDQINNESLQKNKTDIISHSKQLFDLQVGVKRYDDIYNRILLCL